MLRMTNAWRWVVITTIAPWWAEARTPTASTDSATVGAHMPAVVQVWLWSGPCGHRDSSGHEQFEESCRSLGASGMSCPTLATVDGWYGAHAATAGARSPTVKTRNSRRDVAARGMVGRILNVERELTTCRYVLPPRLRRANPD